MAGVARCRCSTAGCVSNLFEYGLSEPPEARREADPVGIRGLPAAHLSQPAALAHEAAHPLHEAEAAEPIDCVLDRAHAHAGLTGNRLQLGVDLPEPHGVAKKYVEHGAVIARGGCRLLDGLGADHRRGAADALCGRTAARHPAV